MFSLFTQEGSQVAPPTGSRAGPGFLPEDEAGSPVSPAAQARSVLAWVALPLPGRLHRVLQTGSGAQAAAVGRGCSSHRQPPAVLSQRAGVGPPRSQTWSGFSMAFLELDSW